ncbi:MAG TPA: DUF72 domain-containing protein [Chloroflexaceae bacterium]|nr:DUF72 domain-containing protein [Chloroflexaceae bacterium]
MTIWIGTSGWSYGHWHGVLYPHGGPPHERLGHYVARFATVELNASYYRWPGERTFASWRRRLPEHFRMSVKAPGLLTHVRRLYGPEGWAARIGAAFTALGERAGVLLVQPSPHLAYDPARLDYFLGCVPRHVRVAVELRHPSWHHDELFALLERHGAAYCVMSGAHLPCVLRATAPFVYVRLHGPSHDHMYAGSYSDDDLRWWAGRIQEWAGQGRDVWAYFNNDGEGHAVRNALALRAMVGA